MHLQINDTYFVSDIAPTDKAAFVQHLSERQIYEQTLAIPFPYTETDADWWINHNIEATRAQGGQSVNWAIRKADGALVGGIGFLGLKIGEHHKAELGYWLAKPYWGKGLMTEVVKKVAEYAFREFGLVRITANVFDFNKGSACVLEKAGFQLEGHLRSHYKKDGKIFDGKTYALLADEFIGRKSAQTKSFSLTILPQTFSVVQLETKAAVPTWATRGDFYAIVRAANELSIVTEESNQPAGVKAEAGWRALKVQGPLDFGMTGVIAALSTALARAEISVFTISTYETDFILVKEAKLGAAQAALERAGHRFIS